MLSKTGDVNYKIARQGKERHSKVVHVNCNCLKRFIERGEVYRLDVVVEGVTDKQLLEGRYIDYNE